MICVAAAKVGTLPAPPNGLDEAGIGFTSGATGPAKGVLYRHHQLQAQRDALVDLYGIKAGDRLVAAFGPFALFGPIMGIPSVVPDVEVTSPGDLTARALAEAAEAIQATLVFASPAALSNVAATADALSPGHRAALRAVRLVMSAGAPVPASVLRAGRRSHAQCRASHPIRHDGSVARGRHQPRSRSRRSVPATEYALGFPWKGSRWR